MTVEEIAHELAGATVYTKADALKAFLQIHLTHEASLLTTFNSHRVWLRFLQMPFGAKMSQDAFQLRMDAILEQCPGVIGIHNDMVIFGVDQDHYANLINLLNVCQKEGLVLNSKKLELRRERVTFFGAEYSAQGMHPDPKKVQGITEMTAPKDKQQLQSFLGMVNYMGTFIPNLSHHTEPLRAMLKKDNVFHWEDQQTRSFQQVKVARHIPRSMTIRLDYFEHSGLDQEYFLDLKEVYLRPKRKNAKICVPNPDHIYEVFGMYPHESPEVVRTSIVDFVTYDPESFKERLVVVFSMLHHNLNSWLLKTKNPANPADEASLYGLCHLYSRHALVYTTGSIWSSLEWRGNYSVDEIKRSCDIHLVFLDGGILGQLHRKPQIPRLLSAAAPESLPPKKQDTSNIVVVSSESDPENKGSLIINENDTPTSTSDHSFASPTPQKRAEIALEKTVDHMQANDHNDHNYAELSDIPTEDDSRNEIITTGGKVILSKSDQVEISLEYQCSETLIEATSEQTE